MATNKRNLGFDHTKIHGRGSYKKLPSGKKSLPEPTHIGHFFVILLMKICKKILLIDTAVKIGVYLIGVMAGSVISDLFAIPRSFFSNKRNFLNQYFVKLGWGWTFCALIVFMFCTSYIYSCGRWKLTRQHLLRLGVATFWWFFITNAFYYIENIIGSCTNPEFLTRKQCTRAGKIWLGFDISGHVFLLIHCLLTISEEMKCFKFWSKLDIILQEDDIAERRKLTKREISEATLNYKSLTPVIKTSVVVIAMLSVLWEFMLIISTIYRFHTLSQKVIAAFLAVGCWFISYRLLFRTKIPWLPVPPGESPLRFMPV